MTRARALDSDRTAPRRDRRALVALAAIALTALVGCAHRLTGPNHGAKSGPWIAPGAARASDEPETFVLGHRVALIGDTGYYLEDDPTLAALGRFTADAARSSVVFLGDNVYDEGMPDDDLAHGEKILGHQLAATPAPKYVIPGNHDWGLFAKNYDAKAIRNQQLFVDGWRGGKSDFVPKDGCMGPEARVLAPADGPRPAVVLIALDPTPWIQPRLQVLCPYSQTKQGVLERLDALLGEHRADFVIVASHYPFRTGGPHGGLSYGFLTDLFVTPLGWLMGGLGNTDEPAYADWIAATEDVLRRNPPELYAAGHDHNLQLLDAGDVAGMLVVSGAGAVERVSTVTHLPQTHFAHAVPGFVVADFGMRGEQPVVRLGVVESNEASPVFGVELPAR